MSSLQSLRELINERLAAAAEEICRLCEGTIVQYEQELCRQRRLLDVVLKPQLQLHALVLPQHWVTEELDLRNQQRNLRVEMQEPEPPQIKEEPGEFCISQDEDQLDLKQETDTLLEIPTYEEDENSEADLNNQQNFNVTDSQDEEGNQHEESTSTTDEETNPQNRDQRKRRDRSHVQSVDSSPMSESDSVRKKKPRKGSLVKKHKRSSKGKRSTYIKSGTRKGIAHNVSMQTMSERPYVFQKCGKSFDNPSRVGKHMRTHSGETRLPYKACAKSFNQLSNLKTHMRTHTGEKQFLCEECDKSFGYLSHFKTHMRTHTGEKPFPCEECDKSFRQRSHLQTHMRIHTAEKPFPCEECDKSFCQKFHLQTHMRSHTGEKPFSNKTRIKLKVK